MLIIARYNEDVTWIGDKEHFIVQKGVHLPNYGREPMSFLWYIINHYDELNGEYIFLQGRPDDHYPFKEHWLETFKNGCPHHPGLPLKKFVDESGVDLPDKWMFPPGGQFKVTGEKIQERPKSFYENLYRMIEEDELMAWVLERVWLIIFK